MTPVFIGHDIYRDSGFARAHPLNIPRVSACMDLCRAMGWLPDEQYAQSSQADFAMLERFHTCEYVRALYEAERTQSVPPDVAKRHHIGVNGNPVFPEMYRRPATAAGGTILAADLTADGGVVYHPAGGTHHGRRDRASGFCYVNDPALGVLRFLDQGLERILYVDVDAHHGDGVQDAFHDDHRVFTLSIHEAGRWPRTGAAHDHGGGSARNIPVPRALNDSEMAFLTDTVILAWVEALTPQAIMLQGGCDALEDDPQSRLSLSNAALWRVVRRLMGRAPRLIVLGGGGYNPWAVARCWSGLWGVLNGLTAPEPLPEAAREVLGALTWPRRRMAPAQRWLRTLRDPPNEGPIRDDIRALAARAAP